MGTTPQPLGFHAQIQNHDFVLVSLPHKGLAEKYSFTGVGRAG